MHGEGLAFLGFWWTVKNKIHLFWGGVLLITAHFCTQPLDTQAATMLHLFLSIYLSSKISLALCLLQISSGILFASEQCLTSAAFQTPPAPPPPPLLFTFSYCSNFPAAALPLAADALPFHSFTPTSNHMHSCILHLQHHIRPVLFLPTTLIYIPPPCPSPPPASSSSPVCFELSGSLSTPKKSFSQPWPL